MQNRNKPRQDVVQKPRQNAIADVPIRTEPPRAAPTETYPDSMPPYPVYDEAPPSRQGGGVRTVLLIVLAVLLVAGGALGTFMFLSFRNDKGADDAQEPQTAAAEAPADAQPTEEPQSAQTPSPQETAAGLVAQMQYVGNAQACAMTAQQAKSFANTIRATQGNLVYAAIFDGGSGVPILWVARGGALDPVNGYTAVLMNGYGDKLYSCVNGQAQEMTWMTTLLRAGTDGIIVKTAKDNSKLQFFYLHNGVPDASPFGVAYWSVANGGSYNGTYLGPAPEVDSRSFYQQAGTDGTVLLEAITGQSDTLMLTGPWISGAQMASLLDQYAAALS